MEEKRPETTDARPDAADDTRPEAAGMPPEASGPRPGGAGGPAAADRKSHRALLIGIVAFAVLLVAAGVAYNALAPAAEREDLVAQPSNTPEASQPGGNAAPGRADGSSAGAASEPVAAPDFTAVDADGREVTLADFRGRPVVLNFWASWCGPCQHEMPAFQAAFDRYGDEVQFLMVNMTGMNGESRETAMRLIEAEDYSFPVFFDQNGSAARAYGVSSIPQTWFVDADGNVAGRAMGALDEARLDQGIALITQ